MCMDDVLMALMVIRNPKLMTMPLMVTLFAVGGQAEAHLGVILAAAMLLALRSLWPTCSFSVTFIIQ